MKTTITCLALLVLTGCAGLDVEWSLGATYQTDELRAKRQRIADEALERARDAQRTDAAVRALQP